MIRVVMCLLFAVACLLGGFVTESQAAIVIGRSAVVVRQPRAVVVRQPLVIRQPQAFVVAPQPVVFQPQQVVVPQSFVQPLVVPSVQNYFVQPSLGLSTGIGCGALLVR